MTTTTNNYVKFLTGELPNLTKKNCPIKPGNIYFAIDPKKKYGYLVYDVDNETRLTMSTRAEIATRFENPTILTIGKTSKELQGTKIGADGQPILEKISFSFAEMGADVKGGWENGTDKGPVLKLAVNDAESNIGTLEGLTLDIPAASATQSGIITTGAQSLAGQKTFNNKVTIDLTKGSDTNGLLLKTPAVATTAQEVISATSSDSKYQYKLTFDSSKVKTHIESQGSITYEFKSTKGQYTFDITPTKTLAVDVSKWNSATVTSIKIPYIEDNECAISTSTIWKPLFYSTDGNLITSSSTVGGTTTPVYLNGGTFTAGQKYAGGTNVTLNGTNRSQQDVNIFAPTAAGADGKIVAWSNGVPTWQNSEDLNLTATKLKVDDAGSATQPIYFKDGVPVGMTFQVLTGKPTWSTGFTTLSLNSKSYAAVDCPGCIFVDTTSNIVYISNGKTWEGMNTYQ